MALNRSDKSKILRRYFPGMTRNSEMSTEPRDLQVEVRPSLPISLGKGLRPVKRVLVKRLRIGVDMTLLIPGFKIGIASELADPPQVEFQGPLFQLGHRHSLEHRFRRFSESAGTKVG